MPGAALGQGVPRTSWGHPDLQGTGRPRPLRRSTARRACRQRFLTKEEAAEFERQLSSARIAIGVMAQPRPTSRAPTTTFGGTAGLASCRRGARHSSLIRLMAESPPHPRGAATAAAAAEARKLRGPADHPEDRNLWERCITRGMPTVMLPQVYNGHYQIIQTSDHVVILAEMIHDARIIPIDGRPHLPRRSVNCWAIQSGGGKATPSSSKPRTSRIRRITAERERSAPRRAVYAHRADILTYRVTIDDPATFTRPWTVELRWFVAMDRSTSRLP